MPVSRSPPSPSSSLSSPLSSSSETDNAPRDGISRLLQRLTKPRTEGGYGGFLNYTEFAAMVTPLCWSPEDVDDCWYDIVKGVPTAEVTDMTRVAEMVCDYCLASPYPLPEAKSGMPLALLSPIRAARGAKSSTPPRAVIEATVQAPPTRVGTTSSSAAAPVQPDGIVDSSLSTSVSAPSDDDAVVERDMAAAAAGNGTATPPPPTVRSTVLMKGRGRPRRSAEVSAVLSAASSLGFHRYAVPTASSARKRRGSSQEYDCGRHRNGNGSPYRNGSCTQLSSAPSSLQRSASARCKRAADGAVFERLYATPTRRTSPGLLSSSSQQQQEQPTLVATHTNAITTTTTTAYKMGAVASPRALEDLRECTFKPTITPYHSERLDRQREKQPAPHRRPTVSSVARLLADGGSTGGESPARDRIAAAPATPRVEVRPAPGPSAHVPPGYVEGVARLRLARIRRAMEPSGPTEYTSGLRSGGLHSGGAGSCCRDSSPAARALEEERRLVDAALTPILRLPLPADPKESENDEGRLRCIDVRLMTPPRRRRTGGVDVRDSSSNGAASLSTSLSSPSYDPHVRQGREEPPRVGSVGTGCSSGRARLKKHRSMSYNY